MVGTILRRYNLCGAKVTSFLSNPSRAHLNIDIAGYCSFRQVDRELYVKALRLAGVPA